jgi:hypothetical protein
MLRRILPVLFLLSPTFNGVFDYFTSLGIPILTLLAFPEAPIEVIGLTVSEVVASN